MRIFDRQEIRAEFLLCLSRHRFQNRRAKEKRVNKETSRRWTTVTHTRVTKKRKTNIKSKRRAGNSSDDGNSHPLKTRLIRFASVEFAAHAPHQRSIRPNADRSTCGQLTGLLDASSYPPISAFMPKRSFSPSSSTITINDDRDSSPEMNFNMITSADTAKSRFHQ